MFITPPPIFLRISSPHQSCRSLNHSHSSTTKGTFSFPLHYSSLSWLRVGAGSAFTSLHRPMGFTTTVVPDICPVRHQPPPLCLPAVASSSEFCFHSFGNRTTFTRPFRVAGKVSLPYLITPLHPAFGTYPTGIFVFIYIRIRRIIMVAFWVSIVTSPRHRAIDFGTQGYLPTLCFDHIIVHCLFSPSWLAGDKFWLGGEQIDLLNSRTPLDRVGFWPYHAHPGLLTAPYPHI